MNSALADDTAFDPISDALNRATLRITVDRSVLETFLRTAPEFAAAALAHFSEFSGSSDVLDALRQQTVSAEQLREFEQALVVGEDEYLVARIEIEPPAAPHLRALWDAIEPGGSNLGCPVA